MSPLIVAGLLIPPVPGREARPAAKPTFARSEAPVTRAEARRTLERLRDVADRALRLRSEPEAIALPNDAKPVTAVETVAVLRRLMRRYEPAFRVTPPLRSGADAFVAYRMIAPRGPLAIGRKTLRPSEFGDAAGYFLVRLADLTHTPMREYSPALMGGD